MTSDVIQASLLKINEANVNILSLLISFLRTHSHGCHPLFEHAASVGGRHKQLCSVQILLYTYVDTMLYNAKNFQKEVIMLPRFNKYLLQYLTALCVLTD